jgi:hypothetical protein
MYVLLHICLPFNFAISKEFDLLWQFSCKYHWHSGAWTQCSWINIWFEHWIQYSSECAMCYYLTTFTESFLVLKFYQTTKSPLSADFFIYYKQTNHCKPCHQLRYHDQILEQKALSHHIIIIIIIIWCFN